MPSELAHLELANRNQKVIDYLLKQPNDCLEWIVTVAFYKSLHVVEAVFARDPKIRHGQSHERREFALKSDKRYEQIYKHYRPLWAASTVARYLVDQKGTEYTRFSDYLSVEQVRNEILGHRLRQLEKSAAKFVSDPSRLTHSP